VSVEARPEPFAFDCAHAAVVVVDMQNDFGARGGMFDLAGIDIAGIEAIVAPTAAVLAAARAQSMPIVYLKMGFMPDLSDTGRPAGPTWIKHVPLRAGEATTAPDGSASRILIRDTWNTEIVTPLSPHDGDLVVWKHRFSGFFETDLDQLLKQRAIDTLVFTGATTSVCVESTLRDAVFRDYRCLLLEDCVAEPIAANAARSNHAASLTVVEVLFGWVSDSEALHQAFETAPA
jgi:ureidoacrylate peracid hydrolase